MQYLNDKYDVPELSIWTCNPAQDTKHNSLRNVFHIKLEYLYTNQIYIPRGIGQAERAGCVAVREWRGKTYAYLLVSPLLIYN